MRPGGSSALIIAALAASAAFAKPPAPAPAEAPHAVLDVLGLPSDGGAAHSDIGLPPTLRKGSSKTGSLDKNHIKAVIHAQQPAIRACYEQYLGRVDSSAKVTFRFVIEPDGSVSGAEAVTGTLSDELLTGCVRGTILKLQFPRPKGGGAVHVTYPFHFRRGLPPRDAGV